MRILFVLLMIINFCSGSKVIIVGAGASGISAANHLQELGHDVLVLEGRNRIGGRVNTDYSLGYPIELGAQFIQGTEGNPVHKIALELGIELTEFDHKNHKLYSYQFTKEELEKSELEFNKIGEHFLDEFMKSQINNPKIILDNFLNEYILKNRISKLNEALVREYVLYHLAGTGTNIRDYSYLNNSEGITMGGHVLIMPGGYVKIFDSLAKSLNIKFEQIISEIKQENNKVKVKCKNNEEYEADYLVLTVPLGYLKKT
jgi:monoamine oxidase